VGAQLQGHRWGGAGCRRYSRHRSKQHLFSGLTYLGASWRLMFWGRLRAQRAAAGGFRGRPTRLRICSAVSRCDHGEKLVTGNRNATPRCSCEQDVRSVRRATELAKIREAAGKSQSWTWSGASASLNEGRSQLQKCRLCTARHVATWRCSSGGYRPARGGGLWLRPNSEPVQAGLPGSLLERARSPRGRTPSTSAFARSRLKLALLRGITLTAEGGRLNDRLLSLLNLNPTLFHTAVQIYVPDLSRWRLARQNQDFLSSTGTSSPPTGARH